MDLDIKSYYRLTYISTKLCCITRGYLMFNDSKILILGAGYGGVRVAKKLAKKYKKNPNDT